VSRGQREGSPTVVNLTFLDDDRDAAHDTIRVHVLALVSPNKSEICHVPCAREHSASV
jgi:hypothetical protein